MADKNGDKYWEPKLPSVKIGWDAQNQAVTLEFDPNEFRSWDFVLAVIDMAKQQAEQHKRMAQLAGMQQQAMQAQQAEIVRRTLHKG